MNFRTTIKNSTNYGKISYKSKIILLGSCFSDNIGSKLADFSFNVHSNPYGIIFNPISIEKQLTRVVNNLKIKEKQLQKHNGVYLHMDYHSTNNSRDKNIILEKLNHKTLELRANLSLASHVFITLGTSYVYRHKKFDAVVANCHKMPNDLFSKELLDPSTVFKSTLAICNLLRTINPHINIVFTVSPVRHTKDGLVENSRSKAHLLTGLHRLIDNNKANYFPAYELFMDDLRDYRFYKSDLIHPNEQGVQYVWEKFKESFFNKDTMEIMGKVAKIKSGLNHKPFEPNSAQYKKHLSKVNELKARLLEEYSDLDIQF